MYMHTATHINTHSYIYTHRLMHTYMIYTIHVNTVTVLIIGSLQIQHITQHYSACDLFIEHFSSKLYKVVRR